MSWKEERWRELFQGWRPFQAVHGTRERMVENHRYHPGLPHSRYEQISLARTVRMSQLRSREAAFMQPSELYQGYIVGSGELDHTFLPVAMVNVPYGK